VAHAATPGIGAVLDEAAEHSYKAWAIFEGEKLSKSWNGMLETIMTGKTAAQRLSLNNSFDLMSRAPENVRIFNAAMVDLTRLLTPEILLACNFGSISCLLDVGGGSSELIAAVVKEYPGLRGTVFDLPRCAETANVVYKAWASVIGRASWRAISSIRFRTSPTSLSSRV
jgi:hypothetical protein